MVLGASCEEETPLSISNRAVKLLSADGTSMRESRSVPRTISFTRSLQWHEIPLQGIFLVGKNLQTGYFGVP